MIAGPLVYRSQSPVKRILKYMQFIDFAYLLKWNTLLEYDLKLRSTTYIHHSSRDKYGLLKSFINFIMSFRKQCDFENKH